MATDSPDSSPLSSAASDQEMAKLAPIFLRAKSATKIKCPPPKETAARPKRPVTPPREETLADNPDIAVIVMFRSRFDEALPNKLPNFGPQDIEQGIQEEPPSEKIEDFLCALIGLVLNRKKAVERGHYGRALEEAISAQRSAWPSSWQGRSFLYGSRDFNKITPAERLHLLRTLIIWSLSASQAVQAVVKAKYKQARHNSDENQPLSVQPWGSDSHKRRYFLVQGLDDTFFRIYREADRYSGKAQWYSVAGNIDEMKALATKLEHEDGGQQARTLANRMNSAVPTFEASDERIKKREYRQLRKAAFSRPEPGVSIYEGRTRGKRMRYTFDDIDQVSDVGTRRSNRVGSTRSTPTDPGTTYITGSGRASRQPRRGEYGEGLVGLDSDHAEFLELPATMEEEFDAVHHKHATRSGGRVPANSNPRKRKIVEDETSDEEAPDDEWNSQQSEPDEDDEVEADQDMSEDDLDIKPTSLVVKLKVPKTFLAKLQPGQTQTEAPVVDEKEPADPGSQQPGHVAPSCLPPATDSSGIPAVPSNSIPVL
ncbi:hypothetical protein K470DRAFT_25920 [Piedraia hortae CBS 480.64]|uniref:WHIM1 domain-containing protein n=1 Tax=Piedraia hortae CBS 480.64 TaxID=1314780 RepID=A0A6A7C387_9PEZI|nr:hypothetical protein K470DRAFT_25920 [Piedraia hortae CBS 480.64]